MPITIDAGHSSVLIRKSSYERVGIIRSDIDTCFNFTDREFHVEGELVALGPLPSDDMVGPIVEYLEGAGLVYFDDFVEMSGNWPEWLRVYVRVESRDL